MFAGGCYAGFAGAFWCSGTGIYVKGPLGFAIGAHTYTAGGAALAFGAAPALMAATGAEYFIPKDTDFSYLKAQLRGIWDKICQVADWVREKLGTLVSTVMHQVKVASSRRAPQPIKFSF